MRCRVTLAAVAVFIGSSSLPALAQAPGAAAGAPAAGSRTGGHRHYQRGRRGGGRFWENCAASPIGDRKVGRGHVGAGTGGTAGGGGDSPPFVKWDHVAAEVFFGGGLD